MLGTLFFLNSYTSSVYRFCHKADSNGHQSCGHKQEWGEVQVVEVLHNGRPGVWQVLHTVREGVGILHNKTNQPNQHTNHKPKESSLKHIEHDLHFHSTSSIIVVLDIHVHLTTHWIWNENNLNPALTITIYHLKKDLLLHLISPRINPIWIYSK